MAGRIIGSLIVSALLGGGFLAWQAGPQGRSEMLSAIGTGFSVVGKVLGWLLLVGVAPFATYFLSTWVAQFRRNSAGAALVVFYTAVEAGILAWLFNGGIQGAAPWVFYIAAVLIALLYNVLICDWVAERFGGETA
jgi:hypothetical protein